MAAAEMTKKEMMTPAPVATPAIRIPYAVCNLRLGFQTQINSCFANQLAYHQLPSQVHHQDYFRKKINYFSREQTDDKIKFLEFRLKISSNPGIMTCQVVLERWQITWHV